VAACPYPSQGGGDFLCGRGTSRNPILPDFDEAEKDIPDDLLAAREHLATQLAAQDENAKSQAARLKLVEARYNAGVSNHLELLDAQRESFAAQQSALVVRH
jgi:hypothetical protein